MPSFAPLVTVLSLAPAFGAPPRVDVAPALHAAPGPARDERIAEGVRAEATRRGMPLPTDLVPTTSRRPLLGATGLDVVTVSGRWGGVPLSRPIARVLVDARGDARLVTWLATVGPLRPGRVELSAAYAIAAVEATGRPGSRGARSARLVVEPGVPTSALAYRVDPPADLHAMANPVFSVDAATGVVSQITDRVRTSDVVAYEQNPIATPTAQLHTLDAIDAAAVNLVGPRFQAKNCVSPEPGVACSPAFKATADAMGDFVFPVPDLTDPASYLATEDEFAEASAYYHADKFDVWLKSLGLEGLDCQVAGETVTLVVNLRGDDDEGFDNAFYTGDCAYTVAFGQGTDADFAYDGDVVYHELGHGVAEHQLAGAILFGFEHRPEGVVGDAGGLSEGFADFFSTAYTGDPIMGDYTVPRDNGNQLECPGGMPGEAHDDSEPWAGALFEIREILGEPFVLVVLDAIAMLPDGATYEEASAALLAVAEAELDSDGAATVSEVLEERNMVDCLRVAEWDEADSGLWLYPSNWYEKFDPIKPPSYQVRFTIPEDAIAMTIDFDLGVPWTDDTSGFAYDPILILKKDAPIQFVYDVSPGGIVHVDADPDMLFDEFGVDRKHVTLEVDVEPGSVLYGAFANQGVDQIKLTNLQVELTRVDAGTGDGDTTGAPVPPADDTTGGAPPPPATDTGESAGDGGTDTDPGAVTVEDQSCACHGAAPGRMPPAWAIGLLALAAPRRRHRSC